MKYQNIFVYVAIFVYFVIPLHSRTTKSDFVSKSPISMGGRYDPTKYNRRIADGDLRIHGSPPRQDLQQTYLSGGSSGYRAQFLSFLSRPIPERGRSGRSFVPLRPAAKVLRHGSRRCE